MGIAVPSSGVKRRAQYYQIEASDWVAHVARSLELRLDTMFLEGGRDLLRHVPSRSVLGRVGDKDMQSSLPSGA